MEIENFKTNEVKTYLKAQELINKRDKLIQALNLLHDNYDSLFTISAKAHSSYNYNQGSSNTVDIPLDVLFDVIPTKKDIIEKLSIAREKINNEISLLYLEISKCNS